MAKASPVSFAPPVAVTVGTDADREMHAKLLLINGDALTRRPHDDYAGDGKRATQHQTKWNASPYIGNAIDARLNPTPNYEKQLVLGIENYAAAAMTAPAGSAVSKEANQALAYKEQELRVYNLPLRDLTRAALTEARNSNQGEDYAKRWAGLLRQQAAADPLHTAHDLLRDAHKSPDDDIVSRTGAKVWGEIVTNMAKTPGTENATLAIRLADKAQEWLDHSFTCHNDWGREKKRQAELTTQIAAVRSVAEPIVQRQALGQSVEEAQREMAIFEAMHAETKMPAPQAGNPQASLLVMPRVPKLGTESQLTA